MDEGQYLQDVYRCDPEFGGAGWYGFAPEAHLTEDSNVLTAENVLKLRTSWHAHWDDRKNICLEKTPGNLIRTRFLQAAFPDSYFIVIRRHPVPVSIATQKWSMSSLHSLFEHWLKCDELFQLDKKYLKHVYELTYEDYVKHPAFHHEKIAAFIGTRAPHVKMEELTDSYNERYFEQWSNLMANSAWKSYYRYIARKYDRSFAKRGYSLTTGFGANGGVFPNASFVSPTLGAWSCLIADARWKIERRLRAILPFTVKNLIRRLMGKEPKTLVLAVIAMLSNQIMSLGFYEAIT